MENEEQTKTETTRLECLDSPDYEYDVKLGLRTNDDNDAKFLKNWLNSIGIHSEKILNIVQRTNPGEYEINLRRIFTSDEYIFLSNWLDQNKKCPPMFNVNIQPKGRVKDPNKNLVLYTVSNSTHNMCVFNNGVIVRPWGSVHVYVKRTETHNPVFSSSFRMLCNEDQIIDYGQEIGSKPLYDYDDGWKYKVIPMAEIIE